MSSEPTEFQDPEEQRRARQLSLQSTHPPGEAPGYEVQRCLGTGAYGEVWVATDRNTGRRVAIKFYLHRGGLDWTLLSREVEKLVFLSADRYVVQLLDVLQGLIDTTLDHFAAVRRCERRLDPDVLLSIDQLPGQRVVA